MVLDGDGALKKWSKNKRYAAVFGFSFLLFAGCGAALAYMMSRDNGSNVFTVGRVAISQYETTFPTQDEDAGTGKPGKDGVPDECELVIPYEEITKDPRVKNTGKEDAVVFIKITNPAEMLNLIRDDGKRTGEELCDLFWLKLESDTYESHENHFGDGWIELTSLDKDLYVTDPDVNNEGNGRVYLFGYHTKLSPGEETVPVFEKVQNKKYGSRSISANEVEHIKIESFAIQASRIMPDGSVIPIDEMNEDALTQIYRVYFNQNKDNLGPGTGFDKDDAGSGVSG